ncbi:putative aspartic protease [Podospora australis]|uniref:Aspartic protease n=1 Tax=Podospora australis TaxID=1536484 RepID=A0AAN6WK75_9PEZI|nr:putative aspartic protease [Podospora australis]
MSFVLSLAVSLRSAALFVFLFATATTYAHLLVPFHHQHLHSHAARSLHARSASSVTIPVAASRGHAFVVNVTVGTPPQPLSLLLAPSSPHTWLPKAEAMPCTTGHDSFEGFRSSEGASGSSACSLGVFASSKSSTYQTAEQAYLNFVVAYTNTITVTGVNMTDKFVLGDIAIDDLSMGLVDSSPNQQWVGMLGLGNDATTNYPRPSSRYRPNFVDRLVSSGKIASPAYSIWLNDPEGKSGSLLLGAIDTSRYEGDLVRLKAAKDPYDVFPSAFRVPLTTVNIEGGDSNFKYGSDTQPPITASLSPAETISYFPDELAEGIFAASGATWNDTIQRATIPCQDTNTKRAKTTLRFQLEGPEGPVLNVRLADLVMAREVSNWELAYDKSATLNRNTCLFGIQKIPPSLRGATDKDPQYNIGSSLLRRTYMVFDAANKDVAIASVSAAANKPSAIVPFEKQGARVPSSRFYCVGDDISCGGETNGELGSSTTPDSESTNPDASADKKDDNWKKIVIGVVVPIGALLILVPVIWFLLKKRRQKKLERNLMSSASKSTLRRDADTDSEHEANSFRDDEYGVKVTVSVTGKVEMRKDPPPLSPGLPSPGIGGPREKRRPPELFLGIPGGLRLIPEDRLSKSSGGNSDHSGGGRSNGSGSPSPWRKEFWDGVGK